jgi:mRNA-degrading endonuclease RelE of RelBE toxin-antitoxin system
VPYEVRFAASARRNLRHIPPRIVPAIVEFAYGDLARDPRRVGRPLERELMGTFSARRGPYRLLYRVDDEAARIYILRIDHRANVYRQPL